MILIFSFAATNVFVFVLLYSRPFSFCLRCSTYLFSFTYRVSCGLFIFIELCFTVLGPCCVFSLISWVHSFVVSLCMFYSFVFCSGPRLELRSYSPINQHFRFKFIPKLCPVLFYCCCVVCVCVCVCVFMRRPINRSCVVLILYRFRLSWPVMRCDGFRPFWTGLET